MNWFKKYQEKRLSDSAVKQAMQCQVDTVATTKITMLIVLSKPLPDFENFLIPHTHRVSRVIDGVLYCVSSKITRDTLYSAIQMKFPISIYGYQYSCIENPSGMTFCTGMDEFNTYTPKDIFSKK